MIGLSEKTESACAFVPYLSHGTVANLKIWLRGLATCWIWSSPGRPRNLAGRRPQSWIH